MCYCWSPRSENAMKLKHPHILTCLIAAFLSSLFFVISSCFLQSTGMFVDGNAPVSQAQEFKADIEALVSGIRQNAQVTILVFVCSFSCVRRFRVFKVI